MNRSHPLLSPQLRATWQQNPMLRKVLGSSFWQLGDNMFRLLSRVLVGAWVARYLGAQEFGQYSYAFAFVALFTPLANLGIDQLVIRDLVERPEERDRVLGTAMVLKIAGSLAAALLALGCALLMPHDDMGHVLVGILGVGLLFQAMDVIDLWFRSQVVAKPTALAKSLSSLLCNLLKPLLIIAHVSVVGFAWVSTLETAVMGLGLAWAYQRQFGKLGAWRFCPQVGKRLLVTGFPVIVCNSLCILSTKVDLLLLDHFMGATAVGVYSAAMRLSEIWWLVPTILTTSAFPAILQAKAQDPGGYHAKLGQLFRLFTLFALAVAGPIALLSTPLVTLLFGNGYAAAGPILAIHIWTTIFVFHNSVRIAWLISEEQMGVAMRSEVLTLALNVGLNLWLVPRLGGLGTALASLSTYAFAGYLVNLCFRPTRKMFWLQTRALLLLNAHP